MHLEVSGEYDMTISILLELMLCTFHDEFKKYYCQHELDMDGWVDVLFFTIFLLKISINTLYYDSA